MEAGKITIIGGGLAGVEAAFAAARAGVAVELYEMRPAAMTPAHSFDEASPRKKTIERQADLFAANLLMPLPMIEEAEKAYRANPQHLVGNLAELFLVSREAMKVRLKGLELMPRTIGDKRREYRK